MGSDGMGRMLEEAFQIHGKDKKGRKILRIVGKFFPARELMAGGGEAALRSFLERRVFPELQGGTGSVVVYMHTGVERSENFPGVAALRSVYESLPAAVRDGICAVYFLHPGLQARLFFATFGRFVFSAGKTHGAGGAVARAWDPAGLDLLHVVEEVDVVADHVGHGLAGMHTATISHRWEASESNLASASSKLLFCSCVHLPLPPPHPLGPRLRACCCNAMQWKRKKMEENEAGLAAMRADRAKNDRMREFISICYCC